MTHAYCPYCGLLPSDNARDCRRHPKPESPLERLTRRVEVLEGELDTLRQAAQTQQTQEAKS